MESEFAPEKECDYCGIKEDFSQLTAVEHEMCGHCGGYYGSEHFEQDAHDCEELE